MQDGGKLEKWKDLGVAPSMNTRLGFSVQCLSLGRCRSRVWGFDSGSGKEKPRCGLVSIYPNTVWSWKPYMGLLGSPTLGFY